jgi:L-threonylcarbamoyladenylate synthase
MHNFEEDILNCLKVLQSGGVILYPTDTVWGLGCDATNALAVEKILHIKQRSTNKSCIVLLADERDIVQYVAAPDLAVFDYLKTVEKPTTVVYNHALGIASNVLHENGSVGIRVVKEVFCKTLIKRYRKPIVSTSANISQQPTPTRFSDIDNAIKHTVDYIVKHRQEDDTPTSASAVIEWKNGEVFFLRR